MSNEILKENALIALATNCNNEIADRTKGLVGEERQSTIRTIIDAWAQKAVVIGFNKPRLQYEIGVINKVLTGEL